MNNPASTASAISDEQIINAVKGIKWHDYKTNEEYGMARYRAVLALAAPTAQPTGQEAVGYFLRNGWSPKGDGTKLWEQVADEHKDDADVVPLYERAAVEPSQPAGFEPESLQYKFECVIDHATGGKLSKSGWALATIKAAIDQHVSAVVDDMLEDARASSTPAPAAPSEDVERMEFLRRHWLSMMEGERLHEWLAATRTLLKHGSLTAAIDYARNGAAAIEASTKGAAS